MRALPIACAIAICGAASICPAPAHADIDGDRFSSEEWGVKLRAPRHWQMSERTSYPNILLWMTHGEPSGRMLLSVEQASVENPTAQAYAAATAKLLEEMGFEVRPPQRHGPTGAYYFDFDNCPGRRRDCEGKVFMRQAFLVSGKTGYALTLAAPDVRSRGRLLPAWDRVLRSIQMTRRTPSPETTE